MELTLSILRCPDSVVPEQRRIGGGDYVIGRGADANWVLPDPDRMLSKHHCVLEFRGGGWQVRDLSTNGTFINHAQVPVGRDQVKPLENGDRLRMGAYEIELRMEQSGAQPTSWGSAGLPGSGSVSSGGWDQPAPTQAWGSGQDQPWGAPPPRDEPLQPRLPGDPYLGAQPPAAGMPSLPTGSGLPADFDPFNEGPAMPDHRPSTSDAFLPPRPMQQIPAIPDDWNLGPTPSAPVAPPPPAAPSGATGRIPDDWNFDLSAPEPPAAPRHAPPPAPGLPPAPKAGSPAMAADPFAALPPPSPPAATDPFAALPAAGLPDPFAPSPDAAARPMPRPVAAPAPIPAGPAPGSVDPFAEPPPAVPLPPSGPGPSGARADAGLAAFLAGAGLPPHLAANTDPDAALRALGAAFHAAVSGLRQLLIARADVKREFRIEQTMLRSAGNNPVKFAASDAQALASLLTAGPQVGPRAVRETVEDLTAHQVATLAATQAAARALLARLAPEGIEAREGGGGGGLFASKDKKLWEAYKRLHEQVTEQFDDDFDSAFGKEFARAYEQASRKDG